jgi:CYTH domain-containing protein
VEPGKYARIERERRFLVDALPPIEPTADKRITDLYLDGTRLRLRLSVAVDGAVLRKLTQKVPAASGSPPGVQGWITNTYLSEAEYDLFAALPGRWLRKRRLSLGEMGVDVFEDGLAGLILAEAEFTTDDDLRAFVAPTWCGAEVTSDPAFRGAALALRA